MANFSAGTADVEIGPNFSVFVRQLRADLEAVQAELGVEINPDFTNFVRQLEDYLDAVHATLDVEINPDLTNFATQLEQRLNAIRRRIEVEVGVDQTSLDNLEALIQAKLALMDLRVDVQVGADTRTAADELAALKAAYREMTMNVDADTTAAAAQIGALNGIPVRVDASLNRGSLLSSLGSEPLLLNVGALGLAALPAAATAISSIAVDMQALTQNALLLPGIFAGAAAGASTLAVGLDGLGEALFGDGKKALQAYEGLSSQGRALVDTARAHGREWDRIGCRIQNITLAGLSKPLDQMLDNQLPALDRGMGAVAEQFNAGFKTLLGELGNEQSTNALDKVFGNTATAAGILNGAITPVVNSVRTLAGTGSTFGPQLAQGFTDATTRLDAFLTRANDRGDLAEWMREGIDAGRDFLSIIGNLGSALASILRAAKGDGEGFLATTNRLTEQWATWLKSTEGQVGLKTFFREGGEQIDRWMPILQSVGSMLKTVYEAAQAWSAIILPFLTAASSLLAQHDGLLKTVLISYLAFRTLGPIFAAVQGGILSAHAAVGRFQGGMANAAAGASGFGRTMSGLGAMLGSGGIVMIGLVAAAAAVGILAQRHQEAAAAAAEQRRRLDELRETLAASGDVTEETISTTAKDLTERGFLARARSLGVDPQAYVQAGLGLDPDAKAAINSRLTQVILEEYGKSESSKMQFDQTQQTLGLSKEDVARALQGVPEAVAKFDEAWAKSGNGSIQDLAELKALLNDAGESAATLGGEMNGLGTNTAKAGEDMRDYQAAVEGTFRLTDELKGRFDELGVAVSSVPKANTIVVDAPSVEALPAELRELAAQVTALPGGKVEIILKDEAAKAGIAQITAPATKQVKVELTNQTGYQLPLETRQKLHEDISGIPKPRALGGPIEGGTPGVDSVPILAMPGEHMLDTGDVARLGGQAGVYRFRAALKAGRVQPMREGGAVKPWGAADDIDLAQAQNSVTEAEEKLRELDFKKNVTPSERRKAELALQEALLKVRQLEERKAGGGSTGPNTEILPQAPLPGRRSSAELDIADADAAVDQANTKRNQVYNNPASTEDEKAAADRAYIRAQNQRAETLKSSKQSGNNDIDISLPGIAAKGAGILAEGILAMFGLENSVLSGNNVYARSLNTAINFYANKGQEGATSNATGDYDYTPKNLPVDKDTPASDDSGDSSAPTRSAESYNPARGVQQWSGTFAQVLRALAMPADWLSLGLAQMTTESGGNPKAINNWDSNAAQGTPSKGLMQVIDPTFAANRSALYPNDIWDPSANIAASLRYTVGRYGSPVGVWGQGHGYRDGGWVFGPGGPRDDGFLAPLSNKEFVVRAERAAEWGPQLEAINAGLPLPLPALPAGMNSRGGDTSVRRDHSVNFHAPVSVMDMGELVREQDRWAALQAQGAMAGLPG
ncbi:transglycosylase SLT domain-containing protein [Nocardia sp. NPDC127579]|uniref:transglycosylase SLT domain-containing protein n=1 Tax=Nocardia sp. NPDC127579 TaxID=3345402 RepID=UPI0036399CC2